MIKISYNVDTIHTSWFSVEELQNIDHMDIYQTWAALFDMFLKTHLVAWKEYDCDFQKKEGGDCWLFERWLKFTEPKVVVRYSLSGRTHLWDRVPYSQPLWKKNRACIKTAHVREITTALWRKEMVGKVKQDQKAPFSPREPFPLRKPKMCILTRTGDPENNQQEIFV